MRRACARGTVGTCSHRWERQFLDALRRGRLAVELDLSEFALSGGSNGPPSHSHRRLMGPMWRTD